MEKRSNSLDVLRAIAVLLVLVRHMAPPSRNLFFIKSMMAFLKRGAWGGVDLFFVLSGFLISGLLFKEYKQFGHISMRRFFIRRGFKIYPAFYAMMAVTLFLLFRHPVDFNFKTLFPWLFYLQDYIQPSSPTQNFWFWGPTWSLAVEEQFYISLPILLVFLARVHKAKDNPFKPIPFIFLLICFACLGLRILKSTTDSFTYLGSSFPFHLRADSLFFGVLISYFYHYHPLTFKALAARFRFLLLGFGVVLLIPAFIFTIETTIFMYTFGLTLFYIGCGSILVAVIELSFKENFLTETAASLGRYSYSIYLWHLPVAQWGVKFSERLFAKQYCWGIYAVVYLLGSMGFGIFMAKLIELPLLTLRDRLFPSRSTPISFSPASPEGI